MCQAYRAWEVRYLISTLGSILLSYSSGALIGSQLSGPYGNSRYSAGTLPTSIGFTGQQTDSVGSTKNRVLSRRRIPLGIDLLNP